MINIIRAIAIHSCFKDKLTDHKRQDLTSFAIGRIFSSDDHRIVFPISLDLEEKLKKSRLISFNSDKNELVFNYNPKQQIEFAYIRKVHLGNCGRGRTKMLYYNIYTQNLSEK